MWSLQKWPRRVASQVYTGGHWGAGNLKLRRSECEVADTPVATRVVNTVSYTNKTCTYLVRVVPCHFVSRGRHESKILSTPRTGTVLAFGLCFRSSIMEVMMRTWRHEKKRFQMHLVYLKAVGSCSACTSFQVETLVAYVVTYDVGLPEMIFSWRCDTSTSPARKVLKIPLSLRGTKYLHEDILESVGRIKPNSGISD